MVLLPCVAPNPDPPMYSGKPTPAADTGLNPVTLGDWAKLGRGQIRSKNRKHAPESSHRTGLALLF
jgi:hypothetical protein